MTKTQSTTKIKRGDIILVEVIFSNGVGAKLRPALVLSDNDYNKTRNEVIIAGITSNVQKTYDGDTDIPAWEKAGLRVPSLVTAILQTVKKNRIQKTIGKIDLNDFKAVEANISRVLGFKSVPSLKIP